MNSAATPPVASRSGETWFISALHATTYNHCARPNAPFPDCSFYNMAEPLHARTMHSGSSPP